MWLPDVVVRADEYATGLYHAEGPGAKAVCLMFCHMMLQLGAEQPWMDCYGHNNSIPVTHTTACTHSIQHRTSTHAYMLRTHARPMLCCHPHNYLLRLPSTTVHNLHTADKSYQYLQGCTEPQLQVSPLLKGIISWLDSLGYQQPCSNYLLSRGHSNHWMVNLSLSRHCQHAAVPSSAPIHMHRTRHRQLIRPMWLCQGRPKNPRR